MANALPLISTHVVGVITLLARLRCHQFPINWAARPRHLVRPEIPVASQSPVLPSWLNIVIGAHLWSAAGLR